MGKMVGKSGVVLAVDLQEGMLKKLQAKVTDKNYGKRIKLIRAEGNKIGVSEMIDFALAFYVVHEIKDKESFFRELVSVLKPDGKVLMCEPPLHVSKSAFAKTVEKADAAGLKSEKGPRIFFGRTVILKVR
jgi:ubiquinone/menaquinone biosynthesis C-methylase UbiE